MKLTSLPIRKPNRTTQAMSFTKKVSLYRKNRRREETMTAISRTIHTLVRLSTLEEIYARLAIGIQDLLPDVQAVVVGLYGKADRPIQWVYAIHDGCILDPRRTPELLKTLSENGANPPYTEPARIFSGDSVTPRPAVYAPLATQEEVIGELRAYRRESQPFSVGDQEVLSILASTAAVAIQNNRLLGGLQQSTLDLAHAHDVTLESLARALELRDRETEGHTRRVAGLCVRLSMLLGIKGEALVDIKRGAQLHDIGKMGIPDGILRKPQALTQEEWQIMRRHPEYAVEVLQPIDYLKGALDIPHYHHEKWDGSGYPHGLKGEDIPLAARIFSIIDVWDALISNRPYREAWTKRRAIQYLHSQSGKHFDPYLLSRFLEMIQGELQEENEY